MNKRRFYFATLAGVTTLLTGLAVYQGVPTSWDQVWQPVIQGSITFVVTLAGAAVPIGRRPSS